MLLFQQHTPTPSDSFLYTATCSIHESTPSMLRRLPL